MKKHDKSPKRKVNTKKQTSNNIDWFLDHGIDIEGRIIHLFDAIDNESSSRVIQGVQLMLKRKVEEPIDIYINSFGGCPYASFAIYDFLLTCSDTPINTYCIGCCMSGGSIVFMAGDNRFMYKNSVFMLHTVSSIAEGKVFELKAEADECEEIFKQMCYIYADATTRTYRQWRADLRYKDKYYRKDRALELKMVEKIVE